MSFRLFTATTTGSANTWIEGLDSQYNGEYVLTNTDATARARQWVHGASGAILYFDTTEDSATLYKWVITTQDNAILAKSTNTTLSNAALDPIDAAWVADDGSNLTLSISPYIQYTQLVKAPADKEIASLVLEVYNKSESISNAYFAQYDSNGQEIFSFSLGLQPFETVALDHKKLLPSGYSISVASSAAGMRFCLNCVESVVV